MKANQKGFSVIEILVAIFVIATLGALGWLAYERQKKNDNKEQTDTLQSETLESVGTKEYKGKLVSFRYPKDWTVATEIRANVDDFVSLKTPNYSLEETSVGGAKVKTGAIMSLSMAKSNAVEVRDVDAPFIRGSLLQSKITNGDVQLENSPVSGGKAIEFTWQYEGDGLRIVEFIDGGVFVHATLDTAGEETTQEEYQQFITLLSAVKF